MVIGMVALALVLLLDILQAAPAYVGVWSYLSSLLQSPAASVVL